MRQFYHNDGYFCGKGIPLTHRYHDITCREMPERFPLSFMELNQPGFFMNCCRETTKMGVPPGNRPTPPRDWFRTVPVWYVAGAYTRGRQASSSQGLQLGEKDDHIRGRSK